VGDNPDMASYRQPRYAAILPVVIVTVLAIAAVVMIVNPGGPPVWFLVLWIAALGWNAYWYLVRFATSVEVDGGTLRWRTPLRRGSAPVTAIRRVRRQRFGSQVAVIELDGAPNVYVMVWYGFAGLVDDLRAAAPQADIVRA
jgi:hypothetical protein